MEITSFDSFEAIRKLAIPHRLPGGFRPIFPLVYQIPENPRQFKIFHIFQKQNKKKQFLIILLCYYCITTLSCLQSPGKASGNIKDNAVIRSERNMNPAIFDSINRRRYDDTTRRVTCTVASGCRICRIQGERKTPTRTGVHSNLHNGVLMQ